MNDRDLDRKLQALLDDRVGDRRDAGLRSATLDPEARRALAAYKAVYRTLRDEPPSALPEDFAARVAIAAGYAPARHERELAPWLVAAAVGLGAALLCGASLAALAPRPDALAAAFGGPLGPLTVAAIGAALLDQLLARRGSRH